MTLAYQWCADKIPHLFECAIEKDLFVVRCLDGSIGLEGDEFFAWSLQEETSVLGAVGVYQGRHVLCLVHFTH